MSAGRAAIVCSKHCAMRCHCHNELDMSHVLFSRRLLEYYGWLQFSVGTFRHPFTATLAPRLDSRMLMQRCVHVMGRCIHSKTCRTPTPVIAFISPRDQMLVLNIQLNAGVYLRRYIVLAYYTASTLLTTSGHQSLPRVNGFTPSSSVSDFYSLSTVWAAILSHTCAHAGSHCLDLWSPLTDRDARLPAEPYLQRFPTHANSRVQLHNKQNMQQAANALLRFQLPLMAGGQFVKLTLLLHC